MGPAHETEREKKVRTKKRRPSERETNESSSLHRRVDTVAFLDREEGFAVLDRSVFESDARNERDLRVEAESFIDERLFGKDERSAQGEGKREGGYEQGS
jgi:hypothetical protein